VDVVVGRLLEVLGALVALVVVDLRVVDDGWGFDEVLLEHAVITSTATSGHPTRRASTRGVRRVA